MFIETSPTSSAPNALLYASFALSFLSLCGNAFQYFAGRRERAAATKAKEAEAKASEAEAHKTDSDRQSVDVGTLNTLLATVNEQVIQVVTMRRAHEEERLRDHEEIGALRRDLGECQDSHKASERERERVARELADTKARLDQLESLIKATDNAAPQGETAGEVKA